MVEDRDLTTQPRSLRLFNRHFVLLWQGQLVSQLGSQMFSLALLFWLLETTGSATLMGLIMMASMIPSAMLGPLGGTLADLVSRKALIVWMDVLRGLVALALVAAIWLLDSGDAITAVFVAMSLFGIANAAFNPAMGAAVPDIVPRQRLARANSLMQGGGMVVMTAGQASGGFLYALFGPLWLFFANGVSYLVSACASSFIRIPQRAPAERLALAGIYRRFRADTMEGFRHVWRNPGLRLLFGVAAVLNFFFSPIGITFPIFVREFLGRGPEFLGLMGASQGLGAITGFVLMSLWDVPRRLRSTVVVCGIVLLNLSLAAAGALRSATATLPLLFVMGFVQPLMNVTIQTVIQGTTPSEIRGRVMSVLSTLAMGLMPISMGLIGIVTDLVQQNIPLIWFVVGGANVVVILMVVPVPSFRRFLASDIAREE